MTTAADTNILLDVFTPNSEYTLESGESLRLARQRGPIFVCDVVYAELVPNFASRANLDAALHTIGATLSPITTDIAFDAGLRWGQYRRAGGPRTRILPDFLIGAHAIATTDTLLSRDRGFYATYFPEMQIG